MIKSLFFYIDCTLVSFLTHEIPASTIEALTVAKKRGVQIFIATGRPRVIINHLEPLQERNLIDGYITMNGAYCFVGDEILYKSTIPMSDVHIITDYCAARNIPCIVVGEQKIYACQYDDRVRQIFHEYLKVTAPIPPTPLEEAIRDQQIFQLTPFIVEEEEKEITPYVTHCEMGRWHPDFVDVTASGNTKQLGIDVITKHFHISLSETMAFGDGGNDISMLRHAGVGVAMGNARDHIKAAADYVTTSVDEDGIANALKHFGVI